MKDNFNRKEIEEIVRYEINKNNFIISMVLYLTIISMFIVIGIGIGMII